jgi:hypothetical protein
MAATALSTSMMGVSPIGGAEGDADAAWAGAEALLFIFSLQNNCAPHGLDDDEARMGRMEMEVQRKL